MKLIFIFILYPVFRASVKNTAAAFAKISKMKPLFAVHNSRYGKQ